MAGVQVISGVERRRRWSADQKRAIVAAAFSPGAVVSEVARRADVNSGQIYRWRDELRGVSGGLSGGSGFAQVAVSAGVPAVSLGSDPTIEVMVGSGAQVRMPVSVSPDLASAIVRALVVGR
jgi:transposase